MTRHTLIVEGPGDEITLVPIVADTPKEVFRIGREMFPGRRLAAVNHEDDEEGDRGQLQSAFSIGAKDSSPPPWFPQCTHLHL